MKFLVSNGGPSNTVFDCTIVKLLIHITRLPVRLTANIVSRSMSFVLTGVIAESDDVQTKVTIRILEPSKNGTCCTTRVGAVWPPRSGVVLAAGVANPLSN